MKIGIFTNAYHPIVSGVVKVIDFMRKGLGALGHTVYIIAPQYSGFKDEEDFVFRYPSIRLIPNVDFPLPITLAPLLTAEVKKLPLDIVHAQHPFLLGLLGARLAAKKEIPLVFTFHTRYEDYAHYASFGIESKTAKTVVKMLVSSYVKRCDAVIAPSPSIRDLVKSYRSGDGCHLIPNAIDLTPFHNANGKWVRERYHLSGKRIAIYVGRLAQEKNLLFLLRTFAKAREKMKEAVLLLVGDGPYRQVLETEARRLRIESGVIFAGLVDYKEIPDYLGAAHLFATASTSEVNPLSILESMAEGVPVLAVRAPGAAETVSHQVDGWLTRENAAEFSDSLHLLLKNDEKRKKLGTAARKKAEEFAYPRMAKRLEELYLSLLRPQSARGAEIAADRKPFSIVRTE